MLALIILSVVLLVVLYYTIRKAVCDGILEWHHELDPANRPGGFIWQGKPDTSHALQATLIPRLPLAPMLAAALRDGLL